MTWFYEQLTGRLLDPAGEVVAIGYSGQPPHCNDPDAQDLHNFGPIPQGFWQAVELIPESLSHGPYVIRLEPYSTTQTFRRTGFLIHGERIAPPPGLASNGCIILSRDVREKFWNSRDRDLQVIRGGQ